MLKQNYIYEIFFGSPKLSAEDWLNFHRQLAKLLDPFAYLKIVIRLEEQTFHFYLITDRPLPSGIGLSNFLLKLEDNSKLSFSHPKVRGVFLGGHGDGLLDITNRLKRKTCQFIALEINLYTKLPAFSSAIITYSRATKLPAFSSAIITYSRATKLYCRYLAFSDLTQLLTVDFSRFPNYCYKKFPKYLSSEKILPFLTDSKSPDSAILKVDSFPFTASKCYLNIDAFDFGKHSLILGSSGAGKSRFLSLLIDCIYHCHPEEYKIILIDPHDVLYRDLTTVTSQQVINFADTSRSLDLFHSPAMNNGIVTELLLELLHSLMADNYNSRLERVLRFSSQLLLARHTFSFYHLRRLLLDNGYRNQLLTSSDLPTNVSEFFLTDFNVLKTQSYDLAIAPIIAFLDEVGIVPALNLDMDLPALSDAIEQNFLSIFSLNQLHLGNKMVRTVAGLLLQQIFLLAKSGKVQQSLIVVIDEVAVIEHPILCKFLSELRKYRVTVILAGQYFGQISPELQSAIFANVTNYYLFRVSRHDANILTVNLDLSLKNGSVDDEAKFLAGLNLRECVARLSFGGKLKPAFKARTMDFIPPPYIEPTSPSANSLPEEALVAPIFGFDSTSKASLDELMRETTTNRKKFNGENYD